MTDESPNPVTRPRKRAQAAADGPSVEPAAPEKLAIAKEPEVLAVEQEGAQAFPASAATAAAPEPPSIPVAAIASLRLERGGIAEASADRVDVRMGGIGALDADEVSIQWGGVGAARAETLSVEFGSVGAALTGEMNVTQGFAGSVLAREVTVEQGFVRTLIAQRVTIARPSAVMVMIAQHVSGEVRPLLDWRGALAAGAAFALVSGLLKGIRRR
jgi:hypothetical protein